MEPTPVLRALEVLEAAKEDQRGGDDVCPVLLYVIHVLLEILIFIYLFIFIFVRVPPVAPRYRFHKLSK